MREAFPANPEKGGMKEREREKSAFLLDARTKKVDSVQFSGSISSFFPSFPPVLQLYSITKMHHLLYTISGRRHGTHFLPLYLYVCLPVCRFSPCCSSVYLGPPQRSGGKIGLKKLSKYPSLSLFFFFFPLFSFAAAKNVNIT